MLEENDEGAFQNFFHSVRYVGGRSFKNVRYFLVLHLERIVDRLREFAPPARFSFSLHVNFYKILSNGQFDYIDFPFNTSLLELWPESNTQRLVNNAFHVLIEKVDTFTQRGSNWKVQFVHSLDFKFSRYYPLAGGQACTRIRLPPKIKNKKAVLNLKPPSNECFLYSLLALKNPLQRSCAYKWQRYKRFLTSFRVPLGPISLKQIPAIERANSISINVYAVHDESVYLLQKSKQRHDESYNLLLLFDGDHSHYMPIRSLQRLLCTETKTSRRKVHICSVCLTPFASGKSLAEHQILCDTLPAQTIRMPAPNTYLEFNKYENLEPIVFAIYLDLETVMLPLATPTRTKQSEWKHELCVASFSALKIRCDGKLYEPYSYCGDDALEKLFFYLFLEENRMLAAVNRFQRSLPAPSVSFSGQKLYCWICQNPIRPDELIVSDHSHISLKSRGKVHFICNSRLKIRPQLVVVVHCASSFDSHFLIKYLANKKDLNISIVPRNAQRYLSFSIDHTRFVDSYQFLPLPLSKLVECVLSVKVQGVTDYSKMLVLPKIFPGNFLPLLDGKMKFPYEFLRVANCLSATRLPSIEYFHNSMTGVQCTPQEYEKARRIWKTVGCKTFREFLLFYNLTDVSFLGEIFQQFRKHSYEIFQLDCLKYLSGPSFSMDCCLRFTKMKLELLSSTDLFFFFETAIRGGICFSGSKKYFRANNSYLPDYDPRKPSTFGFYIDCNSLYSRAMMEMLPISDFSWVQDDELRDLLGIYPENGYAGILALNEKAPVGYYFEVDTITPDSSHDKLSQFPPLPRHMRIPYDHLSDYTKKLMSRMNLKRSTVPKLISSLFAQKRYRLHYRLLMHYMTLGVVVTKVHRVVKFRQEAFVRPYIEYNLQQRKISQSELKKELFKYNCNSLYGKFCENKRKRQKVKLVSRQKQAKKITRDPLLKDWYIVGPELMSASFRTPIVLQDRPVYAAASILDLSKLIMSRFYYEVICKIWPRNRLLYSDTDSLLLQLKTEDLYEDLASNLKYFDTSNYATDHPCFSPLNKSAPGKFKDETRGQLIKEVVALRAKSYSILTEGGSVKKSKGVARSALSRFSLDDYKKALRHETKVYSTSEQIFAKNHRVFVQKRKFLSLSAYDDKRFYMNSVYSRPLGHYRNGKARDAPVISKN